MAEGRAKYDRKTLWLKQGKQLRALQDGIRRNLVPAMAQVTLFDFKVRRLMDEIGVWTDIRHQYLSYARALDKSQRTLAFMVDLIRERAILRDRFERRGLEPGILSQIDGLVIFRRGDL